VAHRHAGLFGTDQSEYPLTEAQISFHPRLNNSVKIDFTSTAITFSQVDSDSAESGFSPRTHAADSVQRDRFIINWRKFVGDESISLSVLRQRFEQEFTIFRDLHTHKNRTIEHPAM